MCVCVCVCVCVCERERERERERPKDREDGSVSALHMYTCATEAAQLGKMNLLCKCKGVFPCLRGLLEAQYYMLLTDRQTDRHLEDFLNNPGTNIVQPPSSISDRQTERQTDTHTIVTYMYHMTCQLT